MNNNAGNGGARKDTVIDLTKTKGTRRESGYQAYYRLEGTRLQADFDIEYKNYLKECGISGEKPVPRAAKLNSFLSHD